jgi:hypothetical protein
MLEVSAASSPALAQPGAVLAAAPAAAGGESAQIPDFSALLSSAAGQIEAPAPAPVVNFEGLIAPPALAPMPHEAAVPTGKPGTVGKLAGKILPPGKLPATRSPAVADKAPRHATSDDAAPDTEAAVTIAATAAAPLSFVLPPRENEAALPDASKEKAEAAPVLPGSAIEAEQGQGRRGVLSTSAREVTHAAANSARSIPVPAVAVQKIPADQPAAAGTVQPAPQALPTQTFAVSANALTAAVPLKAALLTTTLPRPAIVTATVLKANLPVASLEAAPTSAPSIMVPAPLATTGEAIAQQAADTAFVGVAAPLEPASARAKAQTTTAKPAQLPAGTTTAPSASTAAVDRTPEAAIQVPSHKDAAAAVPPALATSDNNAVPLAPAEAPVAVQSSEAAAQVLSADVRGAPMPAVPVTAPSPSTKPTQDVAALIDRITEARAAAAPHVVRAALVHEEFGSVSVNFRTEASHIHVTLGSADPGFAPAVQAAAAASLAGTAAQDDANQRRDAPVPEPTAQTPDTAARNDASAQQQPGRDRAPASERHTQREAFGRQGQSASSERNPSAPTPRRRGGIYA